MWPSVKSIDHPGSLEEAYALLVPGRKVIFSGGSYLAADRSPGVETLIDINHLVEKTIVQENTYFSIGAGATLQEISDDLQNVQRVKLAECTRWSCPSKNVRNQRTIGGEVGRRRIDSELFACLHALNAELRVTATSSHTVSIRDWDGDGIVARIEIDTADIQKTVIQRFALLPSAPAFVIVIGVQRQGSSDVAVAGKASRITSLTVPPGQFTDGKIVELAASAAGHFRDDQYGSLAYKEAVIRTGLRRLQQER